KALPDDMPFVKGAVEQEVTASAGPGNLTTDCARFARLFVKLVNARGGNPLGHLLLLQPAFVQHLAKAIEVSSEERLLHLVGDRLYLVHGRDRFGLIFLRALHLAVDDRLRFAAASETKDEVILQL